MSQLRKIISGEEFTVFSRKFDYSINFNLTAEIDITFSTSDGDITAVNETLGNFDIDACVCSDDNKCISPGNLVPIEPNLFVHICLFSINPSVAISNFQMNLQDEEASTNYPVVNFGANTWTIVDKDLTTVKVQSAIVKVSTVVIFDLFTTFENNVVASGSALLESVDENENKRTTTFSSFSLGLLLADIDVEDGGCKQSIFQKFIGLIP